MFSIGFFEVGYFLQLGLVIWGNVSRGSQAFGARILGHQGKKFICVAIANWAGFGGSVSAIFCCNKGSDSVVFFGFVGVSNQRRQKVKEHYNVCHVGVPKGMCKRTPDWICFVLDPANAFPDYFASQSRVPNFKFQTFYLLPHWVVWFKVAACFD